MESEVTPHPGYPDLVLALRKGWGKQTGAMPLSPEHFGSHNSRRGYLFASARGSQTSPYFLLQSPSPYIPLPHQQFLLAEDTLPTMRNHTARLDGAATGLALGTGTSRWLLLSQWMAPLPPSWLGPLLPRQSLPKDPYPLPD